MILFTIWSKKFRSSILFITVIAWTAFILATPISSNPAWGYTLLQQSYSSSGAYFNLDIGLAPLWNTENRSYYRNAFAASNPYNIDYGYKDTGLRLRVRPYYKARLSPGRALEIEGDVMFGVGHDRDVNYNSDPTPGGITQDFSNLRGDFRWDKCNALIAYAGRFRDDSVALFRYDFAKFCHSKDWGFHIVRVHPGFADGEVDRDDDFSLKEDLTSHHISLGIRNFLGRTQVPVETRSGVLSFRERPIVSSGRYFMRRVYDALEPPCIELNGGVLIVRDRQTRWFRNADATWMSLGGVGAPEFIFYEEEDYANVPRLIRDDYEQWFLNLRTRYALSSTVSAGFEGQYYFPTTWNRDVNLYDGPYFVEFNGADPTRTFENVEAQGKRNSWNLFFDITFPITANSDISIIQTVHGRHYRYFLGFDTNWAPGWSVAGRQIFEEDIRENLYETALGYTIYRGDKREFGPGVYGLRNRPFLRPGLSLIHGFAGWRHRDYDRQLISRYSHGSDTFDTEAGINQFFMGCSFASGLFGGAMFAVDCQWDIRNDHEPISTYQWDYGGGDFGGPGGSARGTVTALMVEGDLVYRRYNGLRFTASVGYNWSERHSGFSWGPISWGPVPTLLGFFDTYEINSSKHDLSIMFGMDMVL